VRHGIRVDGGKLYTVDTRDLGSNTMEVQFGSEAYAGIAAAAHDGKTLNYLWSIETSRRAFQFPLDGLRALLPDAGASCGAPPR